ncbi:MAG TPA: hypothetical protein VJN18_12575 [Polyangiaceae bacterium]|nr:hypothetical protein [Polyangiaceae bacterium]
MGNRKASSALVVAGAAVAASAAAAWIGSKRLRRPKSGELDSSDAPDPSYDRLIERDSGELPIGHSADPEIDNGLFHTKPEDETSGASLFGEPEQPPRRGRDDAALDEIWNATPGFAEGEQTEGYDAVSPEDWGAVWLERATQTTHEERPHANDPHELPDLEDMSISEGSRNSSLPPDERAEAIDNDDLDLEPLAEHRVSQR